MHHFSQQQKEIEEKLGEMLGSSPEHKLAKILIETVSSMKCLLATVHRHRRQHDDLEADSITLTFLANNISWIIDEVEIHSPVIVWWRKVIDELMVAGSSWSKP